MQDNPTAGGDDSYGNAGARRRDGDAERGHYLTFERGLVSREALYPRLDVDMPRVGKVRADFEADRYLHSSVVRVARDLRRVDPADGIGKDWNSPMRRAISAACEPLISEWLASKAYARSRDARRRTCCGGRCRARTADYALDRVERDLHANGTS